MRLYAESSRETLRARKLIKEWKHDGLLGKEQYEQLEQETVSDLRTTNIFLRLVLLFFTVLAIAAAVGLFFVVGDILLHGRAGGVWLLIFSVLSYIAAEFTARQARLYRFGVEEALALCSLAFACIGLYSLFSVGGRHSEQGVLSLVSVVATVSSLWLWHRFELWYAFLAAMIFALFVPLYWTSSSPVHRCVICVLYAAGLVCIAGIRSRHRFDYLERGYSLAEAFLWLGIYLVLNLKLTAISSPAALWIDTPTSSEFPAPFYWTTWVLLWCLPPLILWRAVRTKDRFVLAVGMITTVLTLVTNKPYLGWQRHTWDPMLLGIVLVAIAVYLRRWLAQGPDGVRHGFTAAPMSGRHKQAFNVASSAFGLFAAQAITPTPQPQNHEFGSGFGGDSGGGGASGNF